MINAQALSNFWGKISKPVGGEGQRSNKNFGEGQFTGHTGPFFAEWHLRTKIEQKT